MSEGHARLAPSSAEQWGPDRCPASIQMQEKHPGDDDGEAAREGEAAHYAATEPTPGPIAPNGVPITQEMIDHARLFRDAADGAQWVEQRLHMPMVHAECYGTPDAVRYDEDARTVEVIDYKYGHGYVGHWHNPQLLLYAIGAMARIAPKGQWAEWDVRLTIVQPRYYGSESPVRTCRVSGRALAEIWVPRFREAAELALRPGTMAKTGPWCRYCSALLHCEAARKMQGAALDYADTQQSGPVTPDTVGAEMTHIARALRILKDRQTALEAVAASLPRVTGWAKEPKYGRLAWNEPDDAVLALGDALGVTLAAPAKPITPTQAKKLVDAAVIDAYASRPYAGVRLEPERPAEQRLGNPTLEGDA